MQFKAQPATWTLFLDARLHFGGGAVLLLRSLRQRWSEKARSLSLCLLVTLEK